MTDLPKCECTKSIPHRIEDELILLINGKHIDRNIRRISLPDLSRRNSLPLGVGVSDYSLSYGLSVDDSHYSIHGSDSSQSMTVSQSAQYSANSTVTNYTDVDVGVEYDTYNWINTKASAIRQALTDESEMQRIITATQWHKIPIYHRNYHKNRCEFECESNKLYALTVIQILASHSSVTQTVKK